MTSSRKLFVKMKFIGILYLSVSLSSVSCRKHSSNQDNRNPPTYDELGSAVAAGLVSLARTAHRPVSRLGIDAPLDPLRSSSELKYVNEGDLLRLKLVLDNVTLTGFKSLTVQEVTFKRHKDYFLRDPWLGHDDAGNVHHYRGEEEEEDTDSYDYPDHWDHEEELYQYDDYSSLARRDAPVPDDLPYRGSSPSGLTLPVSSEGIVRVSFKQMAVKAKYQVRGSASEFFTFRESGNLTLTSPTVFLTTRLNVTLPGFEYHPNGRTVSRHGRVKVLWARSNVSIGSTSLILQPEAHPPEWVRQQVQSKMEELSSDLSHGHGAIRLLLRRWGRLLKRLIHRTARNLTK